MSQHTDLPTLTLKVDNPILVVLTPYLSKNAWWQDRKGILSLLPDGVVSLNSDHFDSIGKTWSLD